MNLGKIIRETASVLWLPVTLLSLPFTANGKSISSHKLLESGGPLVPAGGLQQPGHLALPCFCSSES